MERITVRLPPRYVEWIDDETDGRQSQAAVVRDVFAAVVDGTGPYAGEQSSEPNLQHRVERLEAAVFGGDAGGRSVASESSVSGSGSDEPDTPAETASGHDRRHGGHERRDEPTVRDALADWSHGRSDDEREASRKIAARALRWLRERGEPASRGDVPLDEWATDDPLDRTADTLWTQVVRPAWSHAADRGYVDQPHSRAYRWTGA